MKWWGVLVVWGAVMLLVAWIAYDPVPDVCQPTQMVHTTLAIMKGISVLCKCLGHFGVNEPVMYRKLIAAFVHLSPIIPDPEVNVTNLMIDDVPARLYVPVNNKGLSRGLVYFHGGGWTFGDLDMYEDMLFRISKRLDAVILSVDYALGPERPFPQAVFDSEAVTRHFIEKSLDYKVDPKRIGLMGDSAGGTLATVISRRLRDSNFNIMPKLQVMVYPVTQALDLNSPSYHYNKDGPFLTQSSMVMYIAVYLFGMDHRKYINDMINNQHILMEDPLVQELKTFINMDRLPDDKLKKGVPRTGGGKREVWNNVKHLILDPDFSPLLASNLSGLPQAYVSTCQYDVLRDDGFFYVHRLKQAGVKVKHDHSKECYHGWIWHRNYVKVFDDLYNNMLQYIDENL